MAVSDAQHSRDIEMFHQAECKPKRPVGWQGKP
jgi:hypothetical protein